MKTLRYLVARHCKIYFKDRATFLTSLITPIILLVLYATFLMNVYKDSMLSFTEGVEASDSLVNSLVGGELVSSLLAVSCVTVAFCVNLVMVKDKAEDVRRDFTVAPVKPSTLAISYFISSLICTLIVCLTTTVICLAYLATTGWYLEGMDVLRIFGGVVMLSLFGTALSTLVNSQLKTNGQASAIGTMVSSGYGFICGAYMPLASFSEGLRNVIGFLPGTYGTALIRNACLAGPFREMAKQNFPTEMIEGIKDGIDCNLYFFGNKVEISTMILIMAVTIVVLVGLFILLNVVNRKERG